MAVYQAKPGGGLFGNIGSMLASTVAGPIAPWIMAANAIYNGAKGDWGNALVSGLGAYNGFSPEKALLGGAAPAVSGGGGAAESVPRTFNWDRNAVYGNTWDQNPYSLVKRRWARWQS